MFKLKFAKMYDNKIFEKFNLKPIAEDYYIAKEDMFCVADGVTRDTIKGEAVPYPKNEEEAKDISQEIFLKVYRNLKNFDGKSAFSTWIYRIAVNTCIDALRKNKGKQR